MKKSCLISVRGWLSNVVLVLFLSTAGSALAEVHYVDVNSTNATPPYTNWTTAARNIQDAVDFAVAGDEIVVSNGTYSPLVVRKSLSIRSVNGPGAATIDGGGGTRCVFLANGASLSGFTLTRGIADFGGGLYCQSQTAVASNCVVRGNVAASDSTLYILYGILEGSGGGACGGTLNNCTLSGNLATLGGGAAYCTLNNCTLTDNSASNRGSSQGNLFDAIGGGAYGCTAINCTVTYNSAVDVDSGILGGYDGGGWDLYNCISFGNHGQYGCEDCYSPGHLDGNNWVGDPLFVDLASGNLRLQSNSPCINAGDNSYVTTATDLDGNPRISGGTVDIGAYEFQFNHAPLALATVSPLFAIPQGGTNRFILSPNNADATIVLDGSQSSDADNDPLQFFWYADGQPNALATGALATNQFAVGPHTVQLEVSDGHDTATAQVSFAVITPATAVGRLMLLVDRANLGSRIKQPLLGTLSAAMSAFDHGNFKAGVDQLAAFQNQVRAQVAPWNPALASELIAAAQKISDVVSGR